LSSKILLSILKLFILLTLFDLDYKRRTHTVREGNGGRHAMGRPNAISWRQPRRKNVNKIGVES